MRYQIEVFGEDGFQKIKMTKLIRELEEVGLGVAKKCVDDALDDKAILLPKIRDYSDANDVVSRYRELGARCRLCPLESIE